MVHVSHTIIAQWNDRHLQIRTLQVRMQSDSPNIFKQILSYLRYFILFFLFLRLRERERERAFILAHTNVTQYACEKPVVPDDTMRNIIAIPAVRISPKNLDGVGYENS